MTEYLCEDKKTGKQMAMRIQEVNTVIDVWDALSDYWPGLKKHLVQLWREKGEVSDIGRARKRHPEYDWEAWIAAIDSEEN